MGTFNQADRTAYIARNLAAPKTAQSVPQYTVTVPMAASAGSFGWQNPHSVPLTVWDFITTWSTAGVGTFDAGTGTGGTGTNNAFIDGGTMDVMTFANGVGGTAGTAVNNAMAIAASGTAGDSVNWSSNEAATGTAVGEFSFSVRLSRPE